MGPGSLTCTRWPQAEALPNGSTGDREPGWELMGDSGAVASGWGEEREGQDVLAWRLGDSMKRLEWRREKQAQKNWWNRLPSPHSGKMRDRRLPGGGSQNRAPQPVLGRRVPHDSSRWPVHSPGVAGHQHGPVACWRDGGPAPRCPAGEGPTAEQDGAPTAGPSARRAAEGLPPSPPPPATSSCREASSSSAGHCPGLLAGPPVRRSPRESCPNVTPSSNPQSASSPSG